MGEWVVLGASVGGAGAGWSARVVLGRLRHQVRVPPGPAELAICLLWTALATRAVAGELPAWWLPVPAVLCWLAVVLTATDLVHRRLPNVVTLAGYPVVAVLLAVACLAGAGGVLGLRALVAGVVLLVVHAIVHVAAPGQLGAGDVKLAGIVGAVLGAVSWPAVLVGQLIAAVVTALLAMVDRRERGAPHGPGMLAGALLMAAYPEAMGG